MALTNADGGGLGGGGLGGTKREGDRALIDGCGTFSVEGTGQNNLVELARTYALKRSADVIAVVVCRVTGHRD